MKIHLKVITNIFLTSISLSVLLGSLLRIIGPITENRKINIAGKSVRYIENELFNGDSKLLSFYNNKLERYKILEKLINKWNNIIIRNPDLDVSCFFISTDKRVYAEINSEVKLPAASSIKIPILIVLLTMALQKYKLLKNRRKFVIRKL